VTRVLIVGGGIGGVATAIALEQVGHEPFVLEQAPRLTEIGAGVGLSANALRVLAKLGAFDRVRKTGVWSDSHEWRRLDNGQTVLRESLTKKYRDGYGGDLNAHRADLLEALVQRLAPERIRLDARVVGLQERPDGVIAKLSNGDELFGVVLVGADGLRSRVRTVLFGEQAVRLTGCAGWRCMIPAADMPPSYGNAFVRWMGPGRQAMTYPIRGDLQTFNAWVPTGEILREEWGPSADLDALRRSFEGVTEDVLELIDCVSDALITPINFRDPLPRWGTERVVLLGDAAHPAPPSAAQGAAMALEDAVTLASCLGRVKLRDAAALSDALNEYAVRRQARTTAMLTEARINWAMFSELDPVQMRARDGRVQGLRRVVPEGESTWDWLHEHDAVKAAEEPLAVNARMRRPESQRAFELWRDAVTYEDRSRLWIGERDGYERFVEHLSPAPGGVSLEELSCNGVPLLRVVPTGGADGPTLLHLHGGAYTMGSARAAIALASRLATAVGGFAVIPDYRLGPEHPYPAALDDVVAAYAWLVRQRDPGSIVVSGECAGGGLALALALSLRNAGSALPAALHVVSPFCDLTVSSASAKGAADRDPWLSRDRLRLCAASYVQSADPTDALVSPVYGDLRGLPPLLIQAAADEALRDDATSLARAAQTAGVSVDIELIDDSVHSFVLFDFLPETRVSLEQLSAHAATALGDTPA
jgi:salicylate hydroxylase